MAAAASARWGGRAILMGVTCALAGLRAAGMRDRRASVASAPDKGCKFSREILDGAHLFGTFVPHVCSHVFRTGRRHGQAVSCPPCGRRPVCMEQAPVDVSSGEFSGGEDAVAALTTHLLTPFATRRRLALCLLFCLFLDGRLLE
jgi:hypothetical protein